MMKKTGWFAAIAGVCMWAAVAAQAAPITYSFSGTTDKGAVSGWFTLDGSSLTDFSFDLSALAGKGNDFSGVNMTAVDNSGGYILNTADATGGLIQNSPSGIFPQGYYQLYLTTATSDPYVGGGQLPYGSSNPNGATGLSLYFDGVPGSMYFGNPPSYPLLSDVSQYALLSGGNYGYTDFNDYLNTGTVTQLTPEPGTGLLMASGGALLLAGFWFYERRRAAGAALRG